jgi:hypothetical protein
MTKETDDSRDQEVAQAAKRLGKALDRLEAGFTSARARLAAGTATLDVSVLTRELAAERVRAQALEEALQEASEALDAAVDDVRAALGPVG